MCHTYDESRLVIKTPHHPHPHDRASTRRFVQYRVHLKRRAVTSGSDALVGTQQRFRLHVVILASSTAKRRDSDNHDE